MKIFKLICKEFGWKFSFTSLNLMEAIIRKNAWCAYHSFEPGDYYLKETINTDRIENDYIVEL